MESTIRELVRTSPWRPIEFEMSSGEWIRVEHPDLILVDAEAVWILEQESGKHRHLSMLHVREARHVHVE